MNLFQELNSLPKQCVYGLFNEIDKRVYIGFTINILVTLPRLLNNINYSNSLLKADLSKLEFRIIETIKENKSLRLRYQYWCRNYSNNGYMLYREYKAIQYRTRIEVIRNPLDERTDLYMCAVKLVSRGYKELTVGLFSNAAEAEAFVSEHYTSIDSIIYADNYLTKRYLKSLCR